MFKSLKATKREREDNAFKKPVVRRVSGHTSHRGENSIIKKIITLSTLPKMRKTMYRSVLHMPLLELEKQIFLVADILFTALIKDTSIDRLFYRALDRVFEAKNAHVIEENAVDYAIAQLRIDPSYKDFAHFLAKKCPAALIRRRDEISSLLKDSNFLGRVASSASSEKQIPKFSAHEPIFLTRMALLRD